MLPQEFIDKVKERTDLKELVEEFTELKKVGPTLYEGHCPHPDHEDNDPSFRVWSDHQSWACMVCHSGKKSSKFKVYGSDCFAFMQWIEPTKIKNFKDAVLYLAKRKGIPIPTDKNAKLYKEKRALAVSYMHNLNKVSLDYLGARGLSKQDCYDWGLGFDGNKITFPLMDRYKNVLGFTKRWLVVPEGANDKYKNSSNNAIFNKSMYLYGIHNIDESFKELRITEGSLDVILAHKYGAKNVMATLGTAFTEGHVEIIRHYKMTPVFIFDGDAAGMKALNKSISMLAEHNIYSKILILPEDKDLADMANDLEEGIEDYINDNAITYGNYLIQDELSKFNAKVNELRLKAYPNLVKILNKVPTQEERNILKSFVKNTTGVDL